MKKIHKQTLDSNLQSAEEKLKSYLNQSPRKRNGQKLLHGSLALLTPLAASSLITNQLNAQGCVFPYQIGAQPDLLLDIDGDGIATFLLANVNASFQYIAVLNAPPGDPGGPANAGIEAVFVSGYYYGAPPATATTSVTFATLNYNGGDPLSSGGTFNLVNANGVTVSINITIAANGNITVNTINGIAPTTCAMLPLPIELVHLDIATKESNLQLSWKTASETNNKGFEIERSTDGANFYKIGWVDGQGTTRDDSHYSYHDHDIIANVNYYYRLKQVDLDGKSSHSTIVTGKIIKDVAIQFEQVAPNPANSLINAVIVAQEEEEVGYALFDQLGKLILEGRGQLSPGLNNFRIDVEQVANGQYYLKLQAGGFSDYKKVSVMK